MTQATSDSLQNQTASGSLFSERRAHALTDALFPESEEEAPVVFSLPEPEAFGTVAPPDAGGALNKTNPPHPAQALFSEHSPVSPSDSPLPMRAQGTMVAPDAWADTPGTVQGSAPPLRPALTVAANMGLDSDKVIQYDSLARVLGRPEKLVRETFEQSRLERQAQLLEKSPGLAAWAAADEHQAALAVADPEGLGGLFDYLSPGKNISALGSALDRGFESMESAALGERFLSGDPKAAEDIAAHAKAAREKGRKKEEDVLFDSIWLTSSVEQFPRMLQTTVPALTKALGTGLGVWGASTLAGAGTGAAAGSFVAPGPGTVAGGVAGTAAVQPAAVTAGYTATAISYPLYSAIDNYKIERNIFAYEMTQERDIDGKPLDLETIDLASSVYGAAAGLLEGFTEAGFLALLRKSGGGAVLDTIGAGAVKDTLKGAVKRIALDKVLRNRLFNLASRVNAGALMEAGTEYLQEWASILTEFVTKETSDQFFPGNAAFTPGNQERALAAGAEGFKAGAWLRGGPIVASHLLNSRARAEAERTAAEQRELFQVVNKTALKEKSPELLQDLLEHQGVMQQSLIPGHEALRLYQSGFDALPEALGHSLEQIQEAAAKGHDLEVPVSRLAARLDEAQFESVLDVARSNPASLSLADLRENDALYAETRRVLERYHERLAGESEYAGAVRDFRESMIRAVEETPSLSVLAATKAGSAESFVSDQLAYIEGFAERHFPDPVDRAAFLRRMDIRSELGVRLAERDALSTKLTPRMKRFLAKDERGRELWFSAKNAQLAELDNWLKPYEDGLYQDLDELELDNVQEKQQLRDNIRFDLREAERLVASERGEQTVERTGMVLYQPLNPDVDLDKHIPVISAQVETTPVWQAMKGEGKKAVVDAIAGNILNESTGETIDLSRKNAEHLISSATSRGLGGQAHIAAVRSVKDLLRVAEKIESYLDEKKQQDVSTIHRFFAPMRYEDSIYTVNMTVKEYGGEGSRIVIEGVKKLYDLKLVKKNTPGLADAGGSKAPGVNPEGASGVTIKQMLDSVNDSKGQTYFQPAPPAESAAFKNWFGASKVVNEDGAPLVVYHVTDADVTASFFFNKERPGENTIGNASNAGYAATSLLGFWGNHSGRVDTGKNTIRLYYRLENPKRYSSLDQLEREVSSSFKFPESVDVNTDSAMKDYSSEFIYDTEVLRAGAESFVDNLRARGFDGIIVENEKSGGTSYVAFESEQIKSVNNRGTFDPNDPRILYQGTRGAINFNKRSKGHVSISPDGYTDTDLVKLREANPTLYQNILPDETHSDSETAHEGLGLFQPSNETRRKFDALPAAKITGKEFFSFSEPVNMAEARKSALAWARENGIYREDYTNIDTGWTDIALRERGLKDSLSHGWGPEKIQAVAALPEFIRGGIFLETTLAHNKKQQGMKSHIFAAKASIPGKPVVVVGFVIKEDANGKRFYDHELTEMKNLDGLSSHAGAIGLDTEKASRTRQGSVMNIVRNHLAVNPDILFQKQTENTRGAIDFNKRSKGHVSISPDGYTVTLGRDADLSTIIHESAHIFQEELYRLEAAGQADERMLTDLRTLDGWLSRFDDEATLKAEYDRYLKSLPGFEKAFHKLGAEEKQTARDAARREYFARGFEAYVRDGVAPSEGLRAAFERFKTWLLSIYRHNRSLGVELSDEVRGVFDRMLATERYHERLTGEHEYAGAVHDFRKSMIRAVEETPSLSVLAATKAGSAESFVSDQLAYIEGFAERHFPDPVDRAAFLRRVDIRSELGARLASVHQARSEPRERGRALFQPSAEEVRLTDQALARDVAAWSESVDALGNNSQNMRDNMTMLNQTPLILQMLGANNLPVQMSPGKLANAMKEHDLSPKLVKQVPAAMADPIMVFRSSSQGGYMVMMLELKDRHGGTVVVPMTLEKETSGGYSANIATSIYGKTSEKNLASSNDWFARQIEDRNLLYRHNKKSRDWARTSRLQLPGANTRTNSARNKIYTDTDLVKLREANPPLYQNILPDETHSDSETAHEGLGLFQPSNETRRKFDALPAAKITGKEFFSFSEPVNMAEARKSALAWARENGIYREDYTNIDTGWTDIALRKKGVDGSLRHGGGPEKIQAVAALPEFIRDGIFLETTPAHNAKQITMKSHIFAAKADIAGKPMVVGFVIKEDENGKRFYDHELTEMKNLDGLVTHSGAVGLDTEKASRTRQGSVMNIVRNHLAVNPDILFQKQTENTRGAIDFNKRSKGHVSISPDGYTVTLGRDADLSTIIHESAHIFQEELYRLEAAGQADERMLTDLRTLDGWLSRFDDEPTLKAEYDRYLKGLPGFEKAFRKLGAEENQAARDAAKREYFARGFEAYMRDGVAPSEGLRAAFERFKTWLLSIYRHNRALGVELSDEVRGVFDRMLATEQEIEAAAAANELFALTKEQLDNLGLTGPDQEYAANLMTAAKQRAAALVDREKNRDRSARVKQWAVDAREELLQQPVYAARAEMREPGKHLNAESLAFAYGEEAAAMLRKKVGPGAVRKEGGQDPDILAARHGFRDGAHMLQAIEASDSLTARVQEMVRAREAEFDAAIDPDQFLLQTEEAARQIELVGRYLARTLGREGLQGKAFSLAARDSLLNMPMRKAQSYKSFSAAMSRALKRERAATARGDFEAAYLANTQARLNLEYARQALDIAALHNKTKREVKRFTAMKKADPVARYLVNSIGLNHGLAKYDARLHDGRDASTAENWIKDRIDDGYPMDIDPAIRSAVSRDWQDMSLAEFETLAENLIQIVAVERNTRKLLAAKDKADFAAVTAGLVETVHTYREAKPIRLLEEASFAVTGLRKIHAAHTKIEALCIALDGGNYLGENWTRVYKPINDAELRRGQYYKALKERLHGETLFGAYSDKELTDMARKKVFVPELGESITKEQRIMMALNMGNDGNYRRLQKGHAYSDEQIRAAGAGLGRRDWTFVQGIWDAFESYKEEAFALHEEFTGLRPTAVEARPLTVSLPNGEVMHLRGGYFPAMYDPGKAAPVLQDALLGNSGPPFAHTRQGHLKERQGAGAGTPLDLSLTGIVRAFNDVITDITFRRAFIDVGRILKDKGYRRAIESTVGPEMYQAMLGWLRDAAGTNNRPAAGDAWLRWARGNATQMAMGFKLTTVFTQPVGLTQTIEQIGWSDTMQGLNMAYGGGIRKALEMRDWVRSASPMMDQRMQTYDRDVADATADFARQQFTPGGLLDAVTPQEMLRFEKWLKKNAFVPMAAFQFGVDLPTWLGAYAKGLRDFNGSDIKAGEYADSVVRMTQGSGQAKDLAQIQRGPEWLKALTMFYSYFNTAYNLTALRVSDVNMYRDSASVLRAANSFIWLMAVPPLLSGWITGRGPDDDEEFTAWAAKQVIAYPTQMVVGLRDVAGFIDRKGFGYNVSAAAYTPGAAFRFLSAMSDLAFDPDKEADIKKLGKLTLRTYGYMKGLPLRQAEISAFNVIDAMDGDSDFELRDLFYVRQKSRR